MYYSIGINFLVQSLFFTSLLSYFNFQEENLEKASLCTLGKVASEK